MIERAYILIFHRVGYHCRCTFEIFCYIYRLYIKYRICYDHTYTWYSGRSYLNSSDNALHHRMINFRKRANNDKFSFAEDKLIPCLFEPLCALRLQEFYYDTVVPSTTTKLCNESLEVNAYIRTKTFHSKTSPYNHYKVTPYKVSVGH